MISLKVQCISLKSSFLRVSNFVFLILFPGGQARSTAPAHVLYLYINSYMLVICRRTSTPNGAGPRFVPGGEPPSGAGRGGSGPKSSRGGRGAGSGRPGSGSGGRGGGAAGPSPVASPPPTRMLSYEQRQTAAERELAEKVRVDPHVSHLH